MNDFQVWVICGNIVIVFDMVQEWYVDEGFSQFDIVYCCQCVYCNGLIIVLGMIENGDFGGVDQFYFLGSLEVMESVSEELMVIVVVGVGKRLGYKFGGVCFVVGIWIVFC